MKPSLVCFTARVQSRTGVIFDLALELGDSIHLFGILAFELGDSFDFIEILAFYVVVF